MKNLFTLIKRETLVTLLTLFVSTFLVFITVYYATGDLAKKEANFFALYVDSWRVFFGGDSHFGPVFEISSNVETSISNGLSASAILVTLALLLTFILSLAVALFILFRREWRFSAFIEQILFFTGSVPIFVTIAAIAVMFSSCSSDQQTQSIGFLQSTFSDNVGKYFIAALILSIGSGMVGELVRTFKLELQKIVDDHYILSARARDASLWKHITRASIVPMTSGIVSKVPFFIGAALIVERGVNLQGIAFCMMLYSRDDTFNFAAMFELSILVVFFVVFMNLINRVVLLVFDPISRAKQLSRGKV
ncbi:MAG: ABC transporter permease subunit [Ignavibacteriae bacterium]|nr:ABC transporter permease subunit [Ignavibacteriota bacterium]